MHRNRRLSLPALALGIFAVLSSGVTRAQEASRSFDILTADSVTVFGDVYEPANVKRPPLILAFHQGGGDARGEYTPIIPRLLAEGYAVMTIDQRQCGGVFEGVNRTVEALPDGVEYGFCDAYPDLEAALSYAQTQGFGRIIAWGSSYSAALAIRLAADHPEEVDRVVALSPASGDPMVGCQPIEPASRLEVPALMVRPEREAAIDFVAADLAAYRDMGHDVYISPGGSHGSSILVEARTGASTEEAWNRVLSFLTADR